MANVYTFLMVIAGVTLLLSLAGVPSATSLLLEKSGIDLPLNPQNFQLSALMVTAVAIFTLAALAGVRATLVGTNISAHFFVVLYGGFLLTFVADLIALITVGSGYGGWVDTVLLAIFLPLSIGYVHSIVSWWAGR